MTNPVGITVAFVGYAEPDRPNVFHIARADESTTWRLDDARDWPWWHILSATCPCRPARLQDTWMDGEVWSHREQAAA